MLEEALSLAEDHLPQDYREIVASLEFSLSDDEDESEVDEKDSAPKKVEVQITKLKEVAAEKLEKAKALKFAKKVERKEDFNKEK